MRNDLLLISTYCHYLTKSIGNIYPIFSLKDQQFRHFRSFRAFSLWCLIARFYHYWTSCSDQPILIFSELTCYLDDTFLWVFLLRLIFLFPFLLHHFHLTPCISDSFCLNVVMTILVAEVLVLPWSDTCLNILLSFFMITAFLYLSYTTSFCYNVINFYLSFCYIALMIIFLATIRRRES